MLNPAVTLPTQVWSIACIGSSKASHCTLKERSTNTSHIPNIRNGTHSSNSINTVASVWSVNAWKDVGMVLIVVLILQ